MANRRLRVDAAELERSESADALVSVSQDFAALAAVFERHLSELGSSDREMRQHVAKAKAAAERGLILCEELLSKIRSSSDASGS